MAKKSKSKKGAPTDVRIKLIRYSLYHPKTPRPLRFGTMRMLRHWTIHRAWKLYQATQRKERGYELERQYNKMRDACEELRLTSQGLYERAVAKSIFRYPIVEFRIPTDTPAQIGWNHEWKRG
ncbi:hypothetical protein L873DRAFT_1707585 [Choiromyces venosus 120613-1]|uniref:Large ribosomal subunit protein mL40 n=1 Tax=Choiromyces venosus 120613-1 TaxID=1336337 RepID=A0A3N4J3X4_9PEZI|nr:hypothetical protein L873DRAFT_1707585 [Choiromyces venosus 120613-1]